MSSRAWRSVAAIYKKQSNNKWAWLSSILGPQNLFREMFQTTNLRIFSSSKIWCYTVYYSHIACNVHVPLMQQPPSRMRHSDMQQPPSRMRHSDMQQPPSRMRHSDMQQPPSRMRHSDMQTRSNDSGSRLSL